MLIKKLSMVLKMFIWWYLKHHPPSHSKSDAAFSFLLTHSFLLLISLAVTLANTHTLWSCQFSYLTHFKHIVISKSKEINPKSPNSLCWANIFFFKVENKMSILKLFILNVRTCYKKPKTTHKQLIASSQLQKLDFCDN